ncbi:MAG TPA: IS66 family transposase, partial [Terriglobales bacterium]
MPAALPDLSKLDADTLRQLIITKQNELVTQHAEFRQTLLTTQNEIEHLKLVIAKLRRMMFGPKSEKIAQDIEQLELKLEELEAIRVQEKAAAEPAQSGEQQPTARPARRPLPGHLARETRIHDCEGGTCPDCGGELHRFGEDVSEVLDYVPQSFRVVRHVRTKYSCKRCERVVEAAAPSRPIERGLPGAGLLAHVLVSKYCEHQPLYRQSEIYARQGVELDRSTLAGWVGAASQLVAPVVETLRQHVVSASKIHADDTPVPVLAPGTGKTKTGRLWTYVRDDRPAADSTPAAVWFAYSPDRRGEHPRQHLASFRGVLQADGYAGFHHLYDTGDIVEAACWAHVRRKFFDIQQAQQSPVADEAIKRIAALYAIEKEIRGKPPEDRVAVRHSRARPLLEDMRAWLDRSLTTLSRKSDVAMAIRYALARWHALTRYVGDGTVEMDNNPAERALRAVCLGRKNYLFAGSDTGGERAAAMYALIGTAKLNGIDPELYLRLLLERVGDHPINRISELLPWNLVQPTSA